jgi:thioredoxin 1
MLALAIPAWAGEAVAPGAALPVADTVTLVDLGAASCKPCKMMAPILEELKTEYQGRAAVVFVDVRYDRPAIERFNVRAIPTQIFFDRSGNEVYRHLGFLDKESMTLVLNRLLAAK